MLRKRVVMHMGFKCMGPTIDEERILALRDEVCDNKRLRELGRTLRAISGTMRLKILYFLHCEPELCVCDLSDILGESISAVSHQLKILRETQLVETRRDSRTIFYSLNKPVVNRYLDLETEEVLIG